MGKVTQRTTLKFEKSTYMIDHITNDNGAKYIEIIQQYKQGSLSDTSIKINADNLPTILYALSKYSDGLPRLEIIESEIKISKKDRQKIISSYLIGVSIKDLAMQTGFEESTIEMLLKNKRIEIVTPEEAKSIQYQNKFRNRKK